MEILSGLDSLPEPRLRSPIVTWGVFDGVHRGHRRVLSQVLSWARAEGVSSALVTFDRHPEEVLRGHRIPILGGWKVVDPVEPGVGTAVEPLAAGLGISVTAILPRGKASKDPVFAGWFSLNGNGEMTGTTWIEEAGFLESPVFITNTHTASAPSATRRSNGRPTMCGCFRRGRRRSSPKPTTDS